MNATLLNSDEALILALRALYERCGYRQYRMSRFEEYDFYAENKEFLSSEGVIAFTDTNGRLMALKPDVTLSIVRSGRDALPCTERLYYSENVYRVSRRTGGFQELLQAGLECVGRIDRYAISEVLGLACATLAQVSPRWILQISHLGILSHAVDRLGLPAPEKRQAFSLIRGKNLHELSALCTAAGAEGQAADRLLRLLALNGPPEEVLPILEKLGCPGNAIAQLQALCGDLSESARSLRIDFSVVNDMRYYNGVVFQGYVSGVPEAVLSGGQYDGLMERLGRASGALGFALSLTPLEELWPRRTECDGDVLLLYDTVEGLYPAACRLREQGLRVNVQSAVPEGFRFRRVAKWTGKEVVWL